MARPLKPATPFAQRLIEARGDRSREQAATELGCKVDTLGGYERGRTFPDHEMLVKIIDIYGISADWLLTGEGDMMREQAVMPVGKREPLNLDRLARIGEAIADLYREENARIYPRQLARLQGETYNDLAETTTSDEEWELGLKITLQRLRRDLRAQPGDGSSKRLA